ncbi:unnamed protein product [Paramecium sonneborni]|uniref:Uncharacterized protein n=1 Tax=Paramecium sonneborni TaxID=65129 RepID=A0A8S1PNA1_9CILI|nr:unnamed protein product [Paramecium sonneborni]
MSSEIQKRCVCGHVRNQNECKNSGFCIWQNDQCILNSSQSYNIERNNFNSCKNYSQEDCRELEKCSFNLGQCIEFTDCSILDKNKCQESSYQCVSDESKCVKILECSDYKTENGCANKNKNGKYCYWISGLEKQCTNVKKCEELPIYLNNHSMCKEGLEECTISEKGYGCIKQMELCSQYVNNFQCFESQQKRDNCFWDARNDKCVEKICENLPFTLDAECKSYLSDCTTNGIHCVKRKQCSDAQNKFGCVTDAEGNKCEYHKNECKIKSCNTAPDSLTNYYQCQDYDNLLDCVTSENKGCKNRPETCYGYINQTDCYSIKQQDCVWYQNRCEQRLCHHAPSYYSQKDCQQYGNCIGILNGGCQMAPQLCQEILEEQFCEVNYYKQICIWLEDQCVLLECNSLKLPYYNNHQKCQEASKYCTFSLFSLGCTDYICDNIQELEYCSIDSSGSICTKIGRCIEKKCRKAPTSYDSNQKCEEWMPQCTVNIQFIQNSKIQTGCIDKMIYCELSIQDQCHTTISGYKCKWDGVNKKCIDQVCTDADPNLYLSNDNCKSFLVFSGPCIIGSSGVGCSKWPTNCNQMISLQQCLLNLQDGTKCFWTDAPKINYNNNVECNTWINNCIYNHSQGGCQDRPNSIACTSSPNNNIYSTHEECYAWNPKCTVIFSFIAEGCEPKKSNCNQYIRKRNCKTTINRQLCYWDDQEQKCMNEDDDNDGVIDCHKRLFGEITHQDCEEFMPKCTINHSFKSCTSLSQKCDYKHKQQCVITYHQFPCKWDDLNQICQDIFCSENTTALTEAECLLFRRNSECQLKINSDGTFGPGCENRPASCEEITDSVICKQTLTKNNQVCYYFQNKCQEVHQNLCEFITESMSNELCLMYNTNCVLQPSGQGCYSMYECGYLSQDLCEKVILRLNRACTFYNNNCYQNYYCRHQANFCSIQKTLNGQLCNYISQCNPITSQKNIQFSSSDRYQECQQYSSSYTYNTNCDCCVSLSSCSQQMGSESICNSSITQNEIKCGYNKQTFLCEDRKCEHLTSPETSQACFDWDYDCIYDVNDVTGCKKFTADDCPKISIIQQCFSNTCFWQDGKCVKHVNCELNTTAVTNRECLLINSTICRLNYTKGEGCAFKSCQDIKDSTTCIQAQLTYGARCKWSFTGNSCYEKQCQDYQIQSDCESNSFYYGRCYWCQLYDVKCSINSYCNLNSMIPESHQDCNSVYLFYTIQFNTKCRVKLQLCSDYTYQEACVRTIDGIECQWYSNACINQCTAAVNIISTFSHLECHSWSSSCMLLNTSECQLLNCEQLTTIEDCSIFTEKCFWDGSSCQIIGDCSNYSSALCLNISNLQKIPCFWNGTQCLEKTCSNKPTPSLNQTECDSWLLNCQWNSNNNRCVEDCTQANISNNTHEQCESYYLNKNCTVKLDLNYCVDLPFSCPLAKKSQCYKDQSGNECFFQDLSGECVNLSCVNLVTPFDTHEKCNTRLKSCTVNITLNGCQQLKNCSNYLIKEQCQIDSNNQECEWIINQNICTIKDCSTAQLTTYSAYGCQQYFGDSCTVNKNLDGCEIRQELCKKYFYKQCISEGQANLSGVKCFWNENKNICLERICENKISPSQSHSDCIEFLSTCQNGGCHIKECFDYNYAIDTACASIFEDKRCVTNGYQCIQRKDCEDVNIIDGCTFDINQNPCVWIDGKCYTKSCETAPVSLIKYSECNAYLQFCTVKSSQRGCIKKQSCQNYIIKEACIFDSENIECIWDDNLNQCFSNQCIDQCGDGIVSSKEEVCDDGNYLPYDGCYKCQLQCPQGCNICNGKICQECQNNGWVLINGVCNSQCGDGYVVGSEQCDDGNSIEFDGCYQCSYSCHQKCLDCYQGICLQCDIGYKENGSYCNNICGDGQLVQQLEQCDDGNLQNNDGCSNICEVEKNWKCQQVNNITQCNYIILPMIILTKLTKTNSDIQEFELSFSEQVRLNITGITEEQFLQMIVVVIENAQNNQYDFEIKPMISITSQLASVAYKIIINFKSYIPNPLLKVTIRSENIVNIQDNTLLSNEIKLGLKSISKMSNDQQQLIFKTALFSKIVMYIILSVSCIAFLFGNLEILWNLLDMLQQLSYMKFHNIEFPIHLSSYFEVFTIGSVTSFVHLFQTDQILLNLFNFQTPIIPAKQKFEQYQINSCFLDSLQTLVTVTIIGFFYFAVSYFFYKILVLIKYQNWPSIFNKKQSIIFFKVVKFIFSFQKLARKQYQYFIYSGLIRIFTSNFYEITFASVLQVSNYNTDTTINSVISLMALITLKLNLFSILIFFSYLSKKVKVDKKLSVLVEGINNEFQQGSKQYFSILLIKKTLFITNLIVFQKLFVAQSIITGSLSGVFSCYIYIYKPFQNKYENMKIFITEIMVMINLILFSVYDIIKSNQNQTEILGWINIGFFTLLLISSLAIDVYQQLQKIFQQVKLWIGNYKKKIMEKKKSDIFLEN